jgi:hypothetical protein
MADLDEAGLGYLRIACCGPFRAAAVNEIVADGFGVVRYVAKIQFQRLPRVCDCGFCLWNCFSQVRDGFQDLARLLLDLFPIDALYF